MAKIKIKSLAAGAEIIASIAVVFSLLLVVASIDQNTRSLQSINDNFLYDLQSRRLRDVISDHEFASIVDRFYAGEELTSVELRRYNYWQVQNINIWEIAFNRYNEGLLPEGQWNAWNNYLSRTMPQAYPEDRWSEVKQSFGEDFVEHIDAAYAGQ